MMKLLLSFASVSVFFFVMTITGSLQPVMHMSRRTLIDQTTRDGWEQVPFLGYRGLMRRLHVGK